MSNMLPLLEPSVMSLPNGAPNVEIVASSLLTWYGEYGRTFSWRRHADPYYILVAEILLRKTTTQAVEVHLPRFTTAFPSIAGLNAASLDAVVAALIPLGLSVQRAVQFKALAVAVESQFGGRVPADFAGLIGLPGVGYYTAAIVAATCGGAGLPAVDTNVARLLARVFGIRFSHAEGRKSVNVWQLAAALIAEAPHPKVRLTWAMLDLAALVCTSRKPKHEGCPLRDICLYYKTGAA